MTKPKSFAESKFVVEPVEIFAFQVHDELL